MTECTSFDFCYCFTTETTKVSVRLLLLARCWFNCHLDLGPDLRMGAKGTTWTAASAKPVVLIISQKGPMFVGWHFGIIPQTGLWMCLLRLKKNGPMAVLDVLAGRFCSFTSHLFGRLITGYQLSKKWGLGKWQPLGGVGSKISSTRTLAGNLRCGEVEQNKNFCFK